MVPPHSQEAEESVIGCVLVHGARLSEVLPIVKLDDFYHAALRAVFEAMLELDADSVPVDVLTVAEKMRSLETFEKLRALGGEDYLNDLTAKVVTVENIAYHARIVQSKAAKRRYALKFQELAAAAYADGDDDEYLEQADQAMLELTSERQKVAGGPTPIAQVMREYSDLLSARVQRQRETGSGITGIPTGYRDVDELLSGVHKGELVIVAARPAMGKTAFAMNAVLNAAKLRDDKRRRKHPALVFSLEMSKEQLAERMVSGEAHIDSRRLRQGEVDSNHWAVIGRATANLADLPIKVETRGSITVAEIRSIARVWRMGLPPEAEPQIVVDYMQLVQGSGKRGASREQDVSEISRGLKLLAKDLNCPVIALSQLNRSLESRTDKRPMLSDLRESGAIEQDADVVAFIYRDEVYHDDEPGQCQDCAKGVAELIVGKQRMGPLGTVHLAFMGSFTRFETMANRGDE